MKYPSDIDNEMIPICDALNSHHGIHTTFCCFGHGIPMEFYICFRCSSIKSLKRICNAFNSVRLPNGDSFLVEADAFGPSNSAKSNEISLRISIRNCWLGKSPRTPMTTEILTLIIKELT